MLNKYTAMISFAENEIIPYDDTNIFYKEESDEKQLRKKYVAFMQRMQDMIRLFHSVQKKADDSRNSLNDRNN